MIEKIFKTKAEWKRILTPAQYAIMREKGTEAAFSCQWKHLEEGIYHCAACGLSLFESGKKFESGTGWPSYFDPINKQHVEEKTDNSFSTQRTEVLCARCGSHLGHVFDDGPAPSGKRYCINSVVLAFVPKTK